MSGRSRYNPYYRSTPHQLSHRGGASHYHLPYAPVFYSPAVPYHQYAGFQRGVGVGSFFASLFKAARPLLVKAGKAVGKQALRTGVNIARDLAFNPEARRDAKRVFEKHIGEAGDILSDKLKTKLGQMSGLGRRGGRLSGIRRRRSGKVSKRQMGGGTHQRKARGGGGRSNSRQRGGKTIVRRRRRKVQKGRGPGGARRKQRRAGTKRRVSTVGSVSRKRRVGKKGRSAVDIFSVY